MAGASLTADEIARQKTAADIRREETGQRPSRQYCGLGDPYTFSSSNVYQFIAETRLALATPRPTAST
jgi:phage protein U